MISGKTISDGRRRRLKYFRNDFISHVATALLLLTEGKKTHLHGVQKAKVRLKLRRRPSTLRISASETESHQARRP